MATENVIIGKPFTPEKNQIGPGPTGVPKGPPKGFVPLKQARLEISSVAKGLLSNDFGTMIPFSIGTTKYMARVEPHFHPHGFKSGPNGWHKGITVYEQDTANSELNPNPFKPKDKVDRQKLFEQIDQFLNKFEDI
jgi:hypothetical protein